MTGDRNNAPESAAAPCTSVRATVVWAPPDAAPREVEVEVPAGSTISDAVLASGFLGASEGLDAGVPDLGVFNRPRIATTLLREGDRVEIYRPLTIDPKQARRIRADVRRRRKGQS